MGKRNGIVHEAEVVESEPRDPEGLIKAEEPGPEVDWGPRPTKCARQYKANGTRIKVGGGIPMQLGVVISNDVWRFLKYLTAWLAQQKIINSIEAVDAARSKGRVGRGPGSGGAVMPNIGDAIEYMVSAYGAMLDKEMREAGYDPASGDLLQLPETTK